MLEFKEFRSIRKPWAEETRDQCKRKYHMYQNQMTNCTRSACIPDICNTSVALASCPTTSCSTPCLPWHSRKVKQEGINPMQTTSNISISATAPQSDTSKARDFLLKEFAELSSGWRKCHDETIESKLRKMYNIHAPTIPATSQEIIDAFKNGRVEIDQAKVDRQTKYIAARTSDDNDDDEDYHYECGITERYFGIKFLDLPVEDRKGFTAAVAAYEKLKTDVRRKLAILDPEAGLQVLADFEAWQPTVATTTAH